MNLHEFTMGFAEQFDETDVSEINANTVYQDLEEWSSLTVMTIIAFVKTTYNKTITGQEIRSCQTVKELFELIQQK